MEKTYLNHMIESFRGIYSSEKDVWSYDPAMRDFAEIVLHHEKSRFQSFKASQASAFSILEIGAGKGFDIPRFIDVCQTYTVVEPIETEELLSLQKKYPEKVIIHTDSFPSELIRGRFDLILDNGCFHHQAPEDYKSYFSAIRKIVKHNGSYILNVYGANEKDQESRMAIMKDGRYARIFNSNDSAGFFNEYGFEILYQHIIPNLASNRPYLVFGLGLR